MDLAEILKLRLNNQILAHFKFSTPEEVVKHMGAMQAQDYLGSLWAVALRTISSTENEIEKALADKSIVRTWPMRGTLNYVAAEDVRWMLKLMSPRILTTNAKRLKRDYGLDEDVYKTCRNILVKALRGGKQLARNEVYRVLEEGGVPAIGQRGLHIIWHLAQEGLLCFGTRDGKQPSFTLLDEWIPNSRELGREESLAEIAVRYFNSRGPATVNDFVWWTGLPISAARQALEIAKSELQKEEMEGITYWMHKDQPENFSDISGMLLLPPFDEFLIAYADRSLMLGKYTHKDVVPFSNGMFFSIIVENGQLIGTWKRTLTKKTVMVDIKPFATINKKQVKAISILASKYANFLGLQLAINQQTF